MNGACYHPSLIPALRSAAATGDLICGAAAEAIEDLSSRGNEMRTLLKRWQGAMRFSGVAAFAAKNPENNPVAKLILDTDVLLLALESA